MKDELKSLRSGGKQRGDKEMITPENISKKQAKQLVKLLTRETRCEIIARFGRFDNMEFGHYAIKQMEYKDKIRKLLFGTSDLCDLGTQWRMLQQNSAGRTTTKKKKGKR